MRILNARLWSPDDPFLYDLEVSIKKNGKVIDRISSYFGMRKIAVQRDAAGQDRIFLNNRYTYNLGTLDQGFWPDGLYTAPADAALRFDIEAAKAMGFNTIRKTYQDRARALVLSCRQIRNAGLAGYGESEQSDHRRKTTIRKRGP